MSNTIRLSALEMPSLSEVLFGARGFDTFAALPSNIHAVESSLLFAAGLQTFVVLVGPSGWGKSHLLDAVVRRIRMEYGHCGCRKMTAGEFAATGARSDTHAPLVLDDVQDVLNKPKQRQQLQLTLERRVKTGRQTILAFTGAKPTRQVRGFLPCGREWVVCTIGQPDPAERQIVVRHLCSQENLLLSENLVRLLGRRLEANCSGLKGALQRLKIHQRTWLDQRATLMACGVLNPFFADNPGWDLREAVAETAEGLRQVIEPRDLAIYLLAAEAMLPEADVARYFGVEPAQVYAISSSMRQSVKQSPSTAAIVETATERVVERLLSE
ncbi:MAG TPA: DnaA/Hda family protein [Fimbriimonadaceae bacterium]|nr:DnaA/Hda family protein [Fimbriimonadaceae bacterium]